MISWGSRALPVVLRLTRGWMYRSAQNARDRSDQRAIRPQPFAAAADVVPAIAELVAELSTPEDTVCLAGDSAGGQIALSAALILRDEHSVVLSHTVRISPVLDASVTNPLINTVDDRWLTREGLLEFAKLGVVISR